MNIRSHRASSEHLGQKDILNPTPTTSRNPQSTPRIYHERTSQGRVCFANSMHFIGDTHVRENPALHGIKGTVKTRNNTRRILVENPAKRVKGGVT